jgi:hypothetical protein
MAEAEGVNIKVVHPELFDLIVTREDIPKKGTTWTKRKTKIT